jgi:hypothetical protein
MTDLEWLHCSDPERMLGFLRRCGRCNSERKLRLFACACCQLVPYRLTPPSCRAALAVAEQSADGLCGEEDWAAACSLARVAADTAAEEARQSKAVEPWARHKAAEAVLSALAPWAWDAAVTVMPWAEDAQVGLAPWDRGVVPEPEERQQVVARLRRGREQVRADQAALLREVFGPSPTRVPLVRSAWLAREDAAVGKLAAGIYQEGAFERLPILADALEEVGCDDQLMLRHARQTPPRQHVRGCWLLDALLGRT